MHAPAPATFNSELHCTTQSTHVRTCGKYEDTASQHRVVGGGPLSYGPLRASRGDCPQLNYLWVHALVPSVVYNYECDRTSSVCMCLWICFKELKTAQTGADINIILCCILYCYFFHWNWVSGKKNARRRLFLNATSVLTDAIRPGTSLM